MKRCNQPLRFTHSLLLQRIHPLEVRKDFVHISRFTRFDFLLTVRLSVVMVPPHYENSNPDRFVRSHDGGVASAYACRGR